MYTYILTYSKHSYFSVHIYIYIFFLYSLYTRWDSYKWSWSFVDRRFFFFFVSLLFNRGLESRVWVCAKRKYKYVYVSRMCMYERWNYFQKKSKTAYGWVSCTCHYHMTGYHTYSFQCNLKILTDHTSLSLFSR